jgi:hypothetical protein
VEIGSAFRIESDIISKVVAPIAIDS